MNSIIEAMARAHWEAHCRVPYDSLTQQFRRQLWAHMLAAIREAMECEPTSRQYDAYLNGNTWHDWRALLGALLEDDT